MKAYCAILSARFRLLLQYRAAAVAGLATQFFWGLIRMMIFVAFYESAPADVPMSCGQVVTYIWLSQAFFAMLPLWGDRDVQEMIRTGNVAYELVRPVDLYAMWFARLLAGCTAPTLLRSLPMLALATAAGWIVWPAWPVLAGWAATMVGAVLVSCAISALMTISMFWTVSGQGITRLVSPLGYLLSGMIIPLPLFPEFLQPVLYFLPFRAIVDTPFRFLGGSLPPAELPGVLFHQLAWAAALVLLGRLLVRRAVRRLVVQGG